MMHTNRSEGDEIHITGPAVIRVGKIAGGSRVLLSIDAPSSTIITTTKSHEEEPPDGHV